MTDPRALIGLYRRTWDTIHTAADNPSLDTYHLMNQIDSAIRNLAKELGGKCQCETVALVVLAELCGCPGQQWLSPEGIAYMSRLTGKSRRMFFIHFHNLVNQKLNKEFHKAC